MTHQTNHIPEGFLTVTPQLCIKDVTGAIEFYTKVFGATETMRLADSSGRIGHAEIKIGNSLISITAEAPEWGNHSPQSLGGSPVMISLYVEDVDALASRAVAAGAKVLIPVHDQFYGDRSGRLADPFGHIWIIATHQEDMSPEEMQKRYDDFLKQ